MSFVIPKTHPDSYAWLKEQNPETIKVEHFMACAHDYAKFYSAIGQVQDVERFVQPGDLQTLSNVVTDWPAMEGAPRRPEMAELLIGIRVIDPTNVRTFAQEIDFAWQRCRAWLADKNYDPDNPNETPKERQNRLAAARMRKYRSRINETDVQDEAEMALVRALRVAQDNAKAGKAWVRQQEDSAKHAYDAAVAQAKLARSTTVSTAQAHLQLALDSVAQAERALSEYRINK